MIHVKIESQKKNNFVHEIQLHGMKKIEAEDAVWSLHVPDGKRTESEEGQKLLCCKNTSDYHAEESYCYIMESRRTLLSSWCSMRAFPVGHWPVLMINGYMKQLQSEKGMEFWNPDCTSIKL
jgi:hypothetical protein